MNNHARLRLEGAYQLAKNHRIYIDRAVADPRLTEGQVVRLLHELEAGAIGDHANFTIAERDVRLTLSRVALARDWAHFGYPLVIVDPETLEALAETDPPERLFEGSYTVGVESGAQFFVVRWCEGRSTLAPTDVSLSDNQFQRVTANIAYALPEGLEIHEQRTSNKAMRKQGRKAWPKVQYIIQAARDLHPPAPVTERGPRDEGWTMGVRTLVRGHWRLQAYGPGNSLRKVIWIRPFWRGPDEAPISIHPLRVS